MTDTNLLMDIIKERGITLTAIARRMGLSRYGLHKKIHNVTFFDTIEVTKLCEILEIKNLRDKERIFFAK